MPTSTYENLCNHFQDIAKLEGINALLGWDERTMLPTGGGAYRADQMSMVAGMIHEKKTQPCVGDWLSELSDSDLVKDSEGDAAVTVERLKYAYDKEVKLPQSLVQSLTKASVLGQQAWAEARKQDDFAMFAPQLEEIVNLSIQKADAVGFEECRYDALLDDYEPGAKTKQVGAVLVELGEQLSPLVKAIAESGKQSPREALLRDYPVALQQEFSEEAARTIGFDFACGRLDETDHPFCTTLGPSDCRILTRYNEKFFPSAFFGTLHEAGHGMYEQGLRDEHYGLPPGQYASLGIHESQSRMWENSVGRSRAFWSFFFPKAQAKFPGALSDVSLDEFYWAVNDVRPSLIRVESDEATYNLHIIIRFELEQQLIDQSLTIGDLPEAWKEKYQHYLGIAPSSDANGVLQDIHWSAALFGYFATYSLGNIFAAQMFEAAREALGDLNSQFEKGEFSPLLGWLRENVHEPGQRFRGAELCERVCGAPLSSQPLVGYLRSKLMPLYGLSG
jgi:carboxypeptidase Taq